MCTDHRRKTEGGNKHTTCIECWEANGFLPRGCRTRWNTGPPVDSSGHNTSCFTTPPDFGPGSESRVDANLRGPGINNFDFAVFKRTNVTERMGIEFRTEFFNLFNHPYFAMPATGFNGTPTGAGNGGFGIITGTVQGGVASPERLIQFAHLAQPDQLLRISYCANRSSALKQRESSAVSRGYSQVLLKIWTGTIQVASRRIGPRERREGYKR